MPKDVLYPLRALHGQLHEKRIQAEKEKQQRKALEKCGPNTVFLIGTPVHPNIGDNAIALAEIVFLKKILPSEQPLFEITEDVLKRERALVAERVAASGEKPVLWHGGGNMGDLWTGQEKMRRQAFESFGPKRIVSFPQTIYYSDTEKGRELAEASSQFYNGRPGLTLTAREGRSYEIMRELYPETDIRLMPDIVLSCSAEDFGVEPQQRKGVLMCLRTDIEKSIRDELWDQLKNEIVQLGEHYRVTDMDAGRVVDQKTRPEIVRKKMQQFRGARLAVTDRLHGMVFAALAGTPCVVFSNYNHKVKSTYDWISYLPYIRYADTLDDAVQAITELIQMDECVFDNTPLVPYFDQLKDIILEACGDTGD